jgi:hypothetical protein
MRFLERNRFSKTREFRSHLIETFFICQDRASGIGRARHERNRGREADPGQRLREKSKSCAIGRQTPSNKKPLSGPARARHRRAVNSFSFFFLEIFCCPAPGRRSDHSGGTCLLPSHEKPSNEAGATSECRNGGSDAGLTCLDLMRGVAECRVAPHD